MARKLKIMKDRKSTRVNSTDDDITKKREKIEMTNEGPGIKRENRKAIFL